MWYPVSAMTKEAFNSHIEELASQRPADQAVLALYRSYMLRNFFSKEEPTTRQVILFELAEDETEGELARKLEQAKKQETFSDMLVRLLNARHLKAPDLYHAAGISSKHFSKMVSDRNYRPTKETVLALSIALRLSLDETRRFLEKAGYSFNSSSMSDVSIQFFLEKKIYDRTTIDIVMDDLHLPLLPQNW